MELNLKRPIAFFDLETTGLNISSDRIIEICILKVNPDHSEETFTTRINPTIPISKEASEITGIKDEDVKDCPTFKQIAHKLAKMLENCDIAGFNSNKFDIPLLAEEFLRAEVDFDMNRRKRIDVQVIYHKQEQRNLTTAYKFYCGKNLDDAHSADADTRATYEVLKAQLDKYADLQNNVEFLSTYSSYSQNVDFAGRMIYNEKGEEIFNFGKHKGKKVVDVIGKLEPQYYDWIMKNDFALNTKQVLTQIKLRIAQDRMNGGR